jgi:transcription initiation factor TFIID subunit 8
MEISSSLKKQRDGPTSKRTHSLSHIQSLPPNTEAAPQDETFIQAQLLRSICTALAIVGYDSVKPSALEMFRAELEEYMINFLTTVKHSMTSSRRTTAIPQDFIFALTSTHISAYAYQKTFPILKSSRQHLQNPLLPI